MEVACAAVNKIDGIPQSYEEAMASPEKPHWIAAMDEEITALKQNGTWKLTPLPGGMNLVGCKWVYTKKLNSDGSLNRYKARLVAKGFSQKQGVDFHEVFAPTLRYESWRLLMAIAAIQDLEVDHMDVSNAFLNGTLKEEVYMQQPPGYETGVGLVCYLIKTLYGTRQAPHEWNNEINEFILSLGFTRCKSDSCIYVKKSATGRTMIVSLFVDDIIPVYAKEDKAEWGVLRSKFLAKYKMKDMGPAKWVLGMSVIRNRAERTIHIGQELYLLKILKQFGMESCNATHTPAEDTVLSRLGPCCTPCCPLDGTSLNP